MRFALPALLVIGGVVLSVLTVAVDPMASVHPEALLRYGRAVGALVLHTGASLLGGAAVIGQLRGRWAPGIPQEVHWLPALVTGWLLWGLLLLPVAGLGLLSPWSAWIPALLLGLLAITRPRVALPAPSAAVLAACGLVGTIGLIDAGAPPIDTDELYQHLALPSQTLRTGILPGGILHPDGSRPQLLTLLITPLLAVGTDTAPRLLSTLCAAGILLGVEDRIRAIVPQHAPAATGLAMLVLTGSYTFLHEVGLAANNLPTALAVLGAAGAGLSGMPIALVCTAAAALSFKYTAAGALVGIWMVARLSYRARGIAGLLAILCVAPWWVRNAVEQLHPLFPYAGWDQLPAGAPPGDLTFQYLEKYGAGRTAKDLLLLPWNAVMTAEVGSFRFLGRLTPLMLLLAPFPLLAMRKHHELRPLVLVSMVSCVAWAAGPHWLRHLLPALPILAIALGASAARVTPAHRPWVALVTAMVFAAGAPANLAPVGAHLSDRLPVALGQESRSTYLERSVRSAEAVKWLNANTPEDAVVAVLYEWPVHLIERRTVLGSVEDHVPTRYWMLVHEEQGLRALQEAGVTHLIVGRFRFLRKWYPFLSDAVFESMFRAPTQLLEDRLLLDATLMFESQHTRVYRLDGDFGGTSPADGQPESNSTDPSGSRASEHLSPE